MPFCLTSVLGSVMVELVVVGLSRSYSLAPPPPPPPSSVSSPRMEPPLPPPPLSLPQNMTQVKAWRKFSVRKMNNSGFTFRVVKIRQWVITEKGEKTSIEWLINSCPIW